MKSFTIQEFVFMQKVFTPTAPFEFMIVDSGQWQHWKPQYIAIAGFARYHYMFRIGDISFKLTP